MIGTAPVFEVGLPVVSNQAGEIWISDVIQLGLRCLICFSLINDTTYNRVVRKSDW